MDNSNNSNSGVNTILIVLILLLLVAGAVWIFRGGIANEPAPDSADINVSIPSPSGNSEE